MPLTAEDAQEITKYLAAHWDDYTFTAIHSSNPNSIHISTGNFKGVACLADMLSDNETLPQPIRDIVNNNDLSQIAIVVPRKTFTNSVEAISFHQDLSTEYAMITKLDQLGMPVAKPYCEPCCIESNAEGLPAVFMLTEYIQDALMMDYKDVIAISPGATVFQKTFLMAHMLGIEKSKIPHGEAAFHQLGDLQNEIVKKVSNLTSLEKEEVIKRVTNFMEDLKNIVTPMLQAQGTPPKVIGIIDLQLIIDKNGKVSVIDPLDIIAITSTDSRAHQFSSEFHPGIPVNHNNKNDLNSTIAWLKSINQFMTNELPCELGLKSKSTIKATPLPRQLNTSGASQTQIMSEQYVQMIRRASRTLPLGGASTKSMTFRNMNPEKLPLQIKKDNISLPSSQIIIDKKPPPKREKDNITSLSSQIIIDKKTK